MRFLPLSPSVLSLVSAASLLVSALPLRAQTGVEFSCAARPAGKAVALTAATRYATGTSQPSFGFDLVASPATIARGACSSDQPFFFSIAVPDGNYQVSLDLGGPSASTTTVRAESRRLFVDRLHLDAGASQKVVFNVNVRSAPIAGGSVVKLKQREIGALDWDNKLTLEFNGVNPSVRSISIHAIHDIPTVYIAGDSTVVDQDKEPWAAWGQMLPVFFGPGIAFANEAESGETIRSFTGERRFDKIFSTIKSGDFLMIQFAHNDQKPGSGYVPARTDFKDYLVKYIGMARAKGASVILVTPMNRRHFDAQGKIEQTLGDYPEVMREVAADQHVPLIDLNAMSKTLFDAMGPDGTLKAFVHYPAHTFPGQDAELKDDTHFNSYGAYELARAIVQSIEDQRLALAQYLRKDIPSFNPAKPDAAADYVWPLSPLVSTETPYGR